MCRSSVEVKENRQRLEKRMTDRQTDRLTDRQTGKGRLQVDATSFTTLRVEAERLTMKRNTEKDKVNKEIN